MVELEGGALIGTATLWGIDNHRRSAHIGLGLLPSSRSKGYGTDTVATLCHYGFFVRGLQRLQIERSGPRLAMTVGMRVFKASVKRRTAGTGEGGNTVPTARDGGGPPGDTAAPAGRLRK